MRSARRPGGWTGSTPPDVPGPLPPGRDRAALVAEVARSLEPIPQGAAVLIAVSGGPDSTACAFLTAEARPDLAVALGHVRHGLRDDAVDLAVVHEHASFLGVPLTITEVVVEDDGRGIEAAARAQRYAALRRQAREREAGWIVLGHTADDQAETLLLRLARGTGVEGLQGMLPVRGGLVRPMLRLRRQDVRRFVLHEGLAAAQDPMNDDPGVARVHLRTQVLPALHQLGGDPVAALCRLAELARVDASALDALAREAVERHVATFGPVRAVPDDVLAQMALAVQQRLVRRVVAATRGEDHPPSAAEVALILQIPGGRETAVPGVRVTRGGGWLAFAPQALGVPVPIGLRIPGSTPWPAAGLVIEANTPQSTPAGADGQLALAFDGAWSPPAAEVAPEAVPPGGRPEHGQVVLGPLPDEVQLRPRRDGDRVATAGGTRRLQDVFVDAGVPRALRDLVPVVAAGDRVLWVPGLVADQAALEAGRQAPAVHLAVRAGAGAH